MNVEKILSENNADIETQNKNGKTVYFGRVAGKRISYRQSSYTSALNKILENLGLAEAPVKKVRTKKPVPAPVVEPVANLEVIVPKTAAVKDVAYIPDKDPQFVPFGEFKKINTIVKSRAFYPMFITGPTGNGKSTMVEQSCAKNKRQYIRLQINGQTDEDQLIGTKTLTDGNIEIVEGPVLIAMRTGSVLLLDELDAADPNNIMCLQSILEGRPYYFKLKNEMIYPADGFNIIATGNTKGRGSEDGKYIGTKMLNEAFLERFAGTLEQDYPKMSVELKIVKGMMEKFECVDVKFAETMVKWADAIRRTYEDGAIDDLITTRRLIQIVQGFSIFNNREMAIEMAVSRFDSITKETFIDVFNKMLPDETPIVEEEVPVEED